ncbi:LysR substrate-binding domain-containing protein [Litoribrevibacter albus]|uniref:Transcriptional regulator GcvA n=1 Tax=Litoribrevibacter albus TaxID=1473156 RepID=A0AA37S657_9GAMM|nr:LysR substrate-binding domain-containing protein [Litoribrevibacter albus]GLQ29602.1 transcriptional regulator GcvA [Litoribrevibacter albus]
MAKRLPSLNVLNAFEAAARHLSFKKAAEELCISPPAMSHQIKVLEAHLGVALFKRLNRALELTAEGNQYFQDVQNAMLQLHRATDRLMTKHQPSVFRISCIPFITNSMLIPNIQSFKDEHPELPIDIQSQVRRANFKEEHIDVAIRHTKGDEPELHYEALSPVLISPVCTYDYWERHRNDQTKVLDQHRIIRLSVDPNSWQLWQQEWGFKGLPNEELSLDNYQAVLDSVVQGLGLAMGYIPALKELLRTKKLMLPFPDQVTEFGKLYLVYLKSEANDPRIQSFQTWIKRVISSNSDK